MHIESERGEEENWAYECAISIEECRDLKIVWWPLEWKLKSEKTK